MTDTGTLFIVATPIGNLDDITLRALEILKQVELIAAEDTRHSSKLLHRYNIKTPLVSLHDFNEEKRSDFIINKLFDGKNIALISDSGTPLISDPGYQLVKSAHENSITVVPIPGPCAAIAALSCSGLPTDKFIFMGFLAPKTKQRIKQLEKLKNIQETMIFYESPHRLLATMDDLLEVFGKDRYAVIAKELTKTFETIYGDTIAKLINWLTKNPEKQKGEFVILVKGADKKPEIDQKTVHTLKLLAKELPPKKAADLTSQITGTNKKALYEILIKS